MTIGELVKRMAQDSEGVTDEQTSTAFRWMLKRLRVVLKDNPEAAIALHSFIYPELKIPIKESKPSKPRGRGAAH